VIPLPPGATLGEYRIVDLLGRGGMGAVYRARDERLGRTVAIKVLSAELGHASAAERFRREARVLASLAHPHIVSVHDANLEGLRPYFVLELATGGSLEARIRTAGRLDWREAARVGGQVAQAIAAIHAAGLIHRDLKPANVLFDAGGNAKVADFGLAGMVAEPLAPTARLTKTGESLGTTEYMSPEQANGELSLAPASDLYSLGALLYTCIVGRPPFPGVGPAVLYALLTKTPDRLRAHAPDVPERLDRLVAQLLAKKPADRPTSAGAVAGELAAIAGSSGEPQRASRRLWLLGGLAILATLGAGLTFLLVRRGNGPPDERVGVPGSAAPPRVAASPSPSPAPSTRPRSSTRLRGHTQPVSRICVSDDGTTAVSVSDDRTVKVWNVPRGAEVRTLPLDELTDDRRSDVALSPDGRLCVVSSSGGAASVFSIATGERTQTFADLGIVKDRTDVELAPAHFAFSPGGGRLVLGMKAGGAQVFDVGGGFCYWFGSVFASGECWVVWPTADEIVLLYPRGNSNGVFVFAWEPGAKSDDETVTPLRELDHASHLAARGNRLAAGCGNEVIYASLPRGRVQCSFSLPSEVTAVAVDETCLAGASKDGHVVVWADDDGRELARLDLDKTEHAGALALVPKKGLLLVGTQGGDILKVDFSP
jgi:serine/threonine-protein kinase